MLLVIALTLACSGDSDDGGPRVPADIVLVPNQPVIPQGLSLKLNATVVDAGGRAISGKTVLFSSSDENVLTVDADGTMHSVGPLGTARVTGDLDGLTNFVDVNISQRIVSVATQPESLVINPTLQAFLSVTLKDFAGNDVFPSGLVTFTSNNVNLVTVDQGGGVQAGPNVGETTITVTADTFHVVVPVRLVQIPASMTIDPVNVVMQPGQTRQLSVTVNDQANHPIPAPVVTYTSNATSVFTVNTTGLVTSVAGNGSGTVTVAVDTLVKDIGVFIGSAIPVAVVHTTQAGTSLYEADLGPAGQLVVTAPEATRALRGTLPAFTLPNSFNTVGTSFGVAVNHAGTRAYVAAHDDLAVIDLTTNTLLAPIPVPGGGTKVAVVVSNDDQHAYVGTQGHLYIVDLAAGAVSDSVMDASAFFLALDPTGQKIYASEGSVREIDLTTRTVTRTFLGTSGPKEVAVAPDGSELYVADENTSQLQIINLASGNLTQSINVRGGAFGLAGSAHLIVVAGGQFVSIYDRVSHVRITEIQVGGTARRPAISADEKTIVVPNEGGWLDFIQ